MTTERKYTGEAYSWFFFFPGPLCFFALTGSDSSAKDLAHVSNALAATPRLVGSFSAICSGVMPKAFMDFISFITQKPCVVLVMSHISASSGIFLGGCGDVIPFAALWQCSPCLSPLLPTGRPNPLVYGSPPLPVERGFSVVSESSARDKKGLIHLCAPMKIGTGISQPPSGQPGTLPTPRVSIRPSGHIPSCIPLL